MSQLLQSLKKKIAKVEKLHGVVKMMKNLSASNVYPCKKAMVSMHEYDKTIQLGFRACMEASRGVHMGHSNDCHDSSAIGVFIFGSDRGMVGRYNERVAEFAAEQMKDIVGEKIIWTVGDKVYDHAALFFPEEVSPIPLPGRVEGITDLVDHLVTSFEKETGKKPINKLYVFYNRMITETAYEPILEKVLPLGMHFDKRQPWPTKQVPDVIGGPFNTFIHLLREYIFVSFYKICAECMFSENVSRLLMMEEAEQNITRFLDHLKATYFLERQNAIDEELFDIVSGYEVISGKFFYN